MHRRLVAAAVLGLVTAVAAPASAKPPIPGRSVTATLINHTTCTFKLTGGYPYGDGHVTQQPAQTIPPGGSTTWKVIGWATTDADALVIYVYTAQPGAMTTHQRGLLSELWGPGMGSGQADRAITAELAPKAGDRVLTKWRYSAFHRTPLADVLWQTERDQLIVCGVYAHIGCLTTCVDAFSRDVRAFLVADAVADFSAEKHRTALTMAAGSCAATPTTDRLLQDLTEAGS